VKRSKIDLLHSQYEEFYMNENETIDKMLTHFTKITNGLSLGVKIDNDQKVRKDTRALPKSWKVKGTTLKDLNYKEKLNFFGFIENRKTHKMVRNVRVKKCYKRRRVLPSK